MSRGRAGIAGCLVTLAVILQVTVLAPLSLPGGGPTLVVAVVAAIALTDGPTAGMLAGFAGGLLADLTPPSDAPLGQSVLVLVVMAEVLGLLARRPSGLIRPTVLIAAGSALAGVGVAGLQALLGPAAGAPGAVLGGVAASTAYNLVLAPAVLLLVGARRESAPARLGRRRLPVVAARRRGIRRGRWGGSAAAGGAR